MAYKRTELENGIYLGYFQTDKFKSEYLSFNFISDMDERKNTSRALSSYLLMRGCKKYPDISSIKNALDELYSANIETKITKRGNKQIVEFSSSWLKNKFALNNEDIFKGTLDIFKEVIFEPLVENDRFKAEYYKTEKEAFRDELRAVINNKAKYAVSRCFEEMDGGNEIGLSELGSEKCLDLLDNEEVFSEYTKMISNSRIEIFYCGSEEIEKIKNSVSEMIKNIKRDYKPVSENEKYVSHFNELKVTEEEIEAGQGKLSLGFSYGCSMGEEEYIPFTLFSEIYGNSPTSKLFLNVREKLSLCYYCRIVPESSAGAMVVSAGIEVSNKEKAQNEILLQLEKMKNGEIEDYEIEYAKKSISNSYKEMYDSFVALKTWYLVRVLADDFCQPSDVLDKILKVSKEEIQEFARRVKLENVYFLKGKSGGVTE